MDIATVFGVVLSIGAIAGAYILEGGKLEAIFSLPAMVLVIGGTLGATIMTTSFSTVVRLPKYLWLAFAGRHSFAAVIDQIVRLAEKARRGGILSLETDLKRIPQPFFRKAVQLLIDGIEATVLKNILSIDLARVEERHRHGIIFFRKAGGFSPMFGILGTVLGLVLVLGNTSDTSGMTGAIATAFIATVWGVGLAYLFFLPVSDKLRMKSEEEIACLELITEGVVAIKSGDNPGRIRARLEAKPVGPVKAPKFMQRLEPSLKTRGFSLLKDIDPGQLSAFLQNEHPQTTALILSRLAPKRAAAVLAELGPELQAEVSSRIATMEEVSPEFLEAIEDTLETHFGADSDRDLSDSGGARAIAEILNLIETPSEKNILQSLEVEDADLAAQVKNMMFVFDDLVLLDDRSIRRLVKEVDIKDLSTALKAAGEKVKNKVFASVSQRVAIMIKEEMESTGPTRLSDIEAAQGRIVKAVHRLEEEGRVIIPGRTGTGHIIV